MGGLYQTMSVACNCNSFESNESCLSSIGSSLSKNCKNCNHCKGNKCCLNLYDSILCSLDEK